MGGKDVRLAPLKTGSTARKVFPVSRTAKTSAAPPLTPGLTPSPGLCEAGFSGINSSGPWIVSPPPLTGIKTEPKASVVTSPGSWIQQTLRDRGVCSVALAILLSIVVLSISLGGYVLLVYLAVSTRNPKYIAFSALLGMFFLVIIVVVLSSGHPAPNLTRQSTAPYNKDEILRAYGLDPASSRRGS